MYEYTTVIAQHVELVSQLNVLGREGWRVVSAEISGGPVNSRALLERAVAGQNVKRASAPIQGHQEET